MCLNIAGHQLFQQLQADPQSVPALECISFLCDNPHGSQYLKSYNTDKNAVEFATYVCVLLHQLWIV
jgi:hypothetical protein